MFSVFVSGLRGGLLSVHSLFRGHAYYGPMVFILLTVPMLLPPFGGASTDAVKLSCLLIGVGLLCFAVQRNSEGVVNPLVSGWVAAWVLWLTVVTFFSHDSLYSLLGSYPRYNSSWVLFVGFGALLWICVYMGKRYERPLVATLTVVSCCVALFGLTQSFGLGYYGGLDSLLSAAPARVPSLLGNPNFSSWWVAAVLPFGLFGVLQAKNFKLRLLWLVFVFGSVWSVVIFSSRGAIAATVVGVLVFAGFMFMRQHKRAAALLLALGCVGGLLFSGSYHFYRSSAAEQLAVLQDSSATDRYVAWFIAGEAWREHPLLGLGPGNFDQHYWQRLPSSLMGGDQYFDDAHNVLLNILADLGGPGLLLFAGLFGLAVVVVLRALRRSMQLEMWMAASAGVAAWLVAALFNPVTIPLWVLLAVLLGVIFLQQARPVTGIRLRWPHIVFFRTVGVLSCLAAIALVIGEYVLVYTIALEPYRKFVPGIAEKQMKLTKFASLVEPFHLETRNAALATQILSAPALEGMRDGIADALNLHPKSARAALLAAQLSTEVWDRTHDQADFILAEQYLQRALGYGQGYPVVYPWAAYFYWKANNLELAEQYAHYAAAKQPRYYYNWLLLAKLYRQKGNLAGMEYALAKAQGVVPGNRELAQLRKQLRDAGKADAVDIHPGEPPVLVRLHQ